MKEYGGYLPLDLRDTGEFYVNDCIALNSARYAILHAIKLEKASMCYIPYYLCDTVKEALCKNKITVIEYNIDDKFMPDLDEKAENNINTNNAMLLVVNYFGISHREQIESIVNKYKRVIVDNTQAFFCHPFDNAYTVYSCRKFFGVPDGAYLIKNGIDKRPLTLPIDVSSERNISFILKSYECGTNYSYKEYLDCERDISDATIMRMSKLTSRILKSIDYDFVAMRRNENFSYIADRLGSLNELKLEKSDVNAPMVYPLLVVNDTVRSKLIENKIYVPQWWKKCLSQCNINNFESMLSQYLLPLPIDQRYSTDDICDMCETVKKIICG